MYFILLCFVSSGDHVLIILSSSVNTLCCSYEGEKVNGLYDGRGVAYFTGGHSYEVSVDLHVSV